MKESQMGAYVYLLEELSYQPGESGPWTKIGYSINPPEWRVDANLKRGNPRTLRLSAVFEFLMRKQRPTAQSNWHTRTSTCLNTSGSGSRCRGRRSRRG